MKRLFIIIAICCFGVAGTSAQPKARRVQQQQEQKSNSNNMTLRQQIDFPTDEPMSGDVIWRRDVYRELDLTDDANAALYYPVEPDGTHVNLSHYFSNLSWLGLTMEALLLTAMM